MKKNILWEEDENLFREKFKIATTPNEITFFKRLRQKQEYEFTFSNDLILHEDNNEDGIFLIRVHYDEYVVGHAKEDGSWNEGHVMNLSQALALNLSSLGLDKDISLGNWLKQRDYKGVEYEHNYDNE